MYMRSLGLLLTVTSGAGCKDEAASQKSAAAAEVTKKAPQRSKIGQYGLGTPLNAGEVTSWDIDVRPDGTGLPSGQGSVTQGARLYSAQCASCHGANGEGLVVVGALLPLPALQGGRGSLKSARPQRTIGSYWPYATTVYDYVFRTMPLGRAQSLSASETYALVAFLLHLNGIVDKDAVLDRETLPAIRMPNRSGFFVPDLHAR